MRETPETKKLLSSSAFMNAGTKADEFFFSSLKENLQHHEKHHHYIQKKLAHFSSDWQESCCAGKFHELPFVMVSAFKENVWKSVPDEEVVLHLTSSGTGGQKSHQFLDQDSLDNVKMLAKNIHHELNMVDDHQAYHYFCLTYDPRIAKDLGTAFTDELLTSFTPKASVYYAFQWHEEKKDFVFDLQRALSKLRELAHSTHPTRILGFPAFLNQILDATEENFSFSPLSWVQTGGGWKGLKNQEIPKDLFRQKVAARLGIPQAHIRDMFGMVEHGIPYVDCEKGEMHIPNYARVLIRDPHTLAVLPEGEPGLIQFLCTYNFSYPATNILTTDYGLMTRCHSDCKVGTPVLKILGRAGIQKAKGCALKALELMETSPH